MSGGRYRDAFFFAGDFFIRTAAFFAGFFFATFFTVPPPFLLNIVGNTIQGYR